MNSKSAFTVLLTSTLSASCLLGCSGAEGDYEEFEGDSVVSKTQALEGCGPENAVPLQGPNVSNRLGSNACTTIIPQFLPEWWMYSDGTARVQIANYSDDPGENAFPLTVDWENTCGTESGTVTYDYPWQQHELGHPDDECAIVIKLGGQLTEDVLVFWGA